MSSEPWNEDIFIIRNKTRVLEDKDKFPVTKSIYHRKAKYKCFIVVRTMWSNYFQDEWYSQAIAAYDTLKKAEDHMVLAEETLSRILFFKYYQDKEINFHEKELAYNLQRNPYDIGCPINLIIQDDLKWDYNVHSCPNFTAWR